MAGFVASIPTWCGVAGGLQVVGEGGVGGGTAPLVSPGFCQTTALIQGDCGCGAIPGWGPLSESCRAPLFFYHHKQIRGSGEYTQMQIAAERPISTLHYNGASCMCRLSQPIKHKMNLM